MTESGDWNTKGNDSSNKKRYKMLHELSPKQIDALAVLSAGGTHDEAARAAGVHRVTVSRWFNNHPAFVAEMNYLCVENIRRVENHTKQATLKSLNLVLEELAESNVNVALKWLSLAQKGFIGGSQKAPVTSEAVLELFRDEMEHPTTVMLRDIDGLTVENVERLLLAKFPEGEVD